MTLFSNGLSKFAALAGLGMAFLQPAQALAYTCWNPAICIAVCGSRTCGAVKANDPDIATLQARLHAPKAVAGLSLAPGAAPERKGYTCWNPAICIAVCGKKTC